MERKRNLWHLGAQGFEKLSKYSISILRILALLGQASFKVSSPNSMGIWMAISQLCTWLNLYPNRRKPFPVLLYNSKAEKRVSTVSVLQRRFPCPDLGALFGWRGRGGEGVGCHEPFWHEHWGHPACVALPGMALPRRGFTSFLSLFPPRFSPLNLQDWLSPSPEQCFQRTFQWVTGNGPTTGEKAAKGAFPVLCTAPQECSGLCGVSFPYFLK